jgi:hypothetical protein
VEGLCGVGDFVENWKSAKFCCEISLPGNSFGIQANWAFLNLSISRSKSEKAF